MTPLMRAFPKQLGGTLEPAVSLRHLFQAYSRQIAHCIPRRSNCMLVPVPEETAR